jgi:branched-chain amino acid transport system ATP-binding protein
MGAEEASLMVELLRTLKPRHAILLVEHDMDAVFARAPM